jgi:hypothetical protein
MPLPRSILIFRLDLRVLRGEGYSTHSDGCTLFSCTYVGEEINIVTGVTGNDFWTSGMGTEMVYSIPKFGEWERKWKFHSQFREREWDVVIWSSYKSLCERYWLFVFFLFMFISLSLSLWEVHSWQTCLHSCSHQTEKRICVTRELKSKIWIFCLADLFSSKIYNFVFSAN